MRFHKSIRNLGILAVLVVGTLGFVQRSYAQSVSPGGPYVSPGSTVQFEAISSSPVALQGVKSVASGQTHTCALMLDGTVKCWGSNSAGELGIGTTSEGSTVPVLVGSLNNVTSIAAGGQHTCALLSNGTVKCWGWNDHGQLGNGQSVNGGTNYSTKPAPVVGLSGVVVSIAAGQEHTCAVIVGGSVECWGWNSYDQLGNNNGATDSPSPLPVTGLSFVTTITAGDIHTCGLEASGDVYCWGEDSSGELGDGGGANAFSPVQSQIANGLKTKALSAKGRHTCALVDNGGVQCWGDLNSSNPGTPTPVAGVSGAKAVASGGSQACALLASGAVQCWGYDNQGQLGNSAPPNYTLNSPVSVGVSGAISIAAGGEVFNPLNNPPGTVQPSAQSYAVLDDGTLMTWGSILGQTDAYGNLATQLTPAAVKGTYLPNDGVSKLVNGSLHTCALMGDGTVQCWGYNAYGQLGNGSGQSSANPVQVLNLTSAVAVAAGFRHSCALLSNGTVQCWGDNSYGQGASCSGSTCWQPHAVANVQNAIAIAAGGVHTCALINDGTVNCWGRNIYTQLCTTHLNCFNGLVSGVSRAVAITAGFAHTCALFATGGASCWGQVAPTGGLQLPTTVSGLGGWVTWATSISAGDGFTCAILFDSSADCFGSNAYYKLGNGNTTNSTTPVAVSGLNNAAAISAGYESACAATITGSVECWGWDQYGQLGNGAVGGSFGSPQGVSGLTNAVGASSGNMTGAALLADGTVQTWGYNFYFDLGNGNTTQSLIAPTPASTSPMVPVLWSSSNPSVATINPSTGLATVVSPGGTPIPTTSIAFTYGAQSASTLLLVY